MGKCRREKSRKSQNDEQDALVRCDSCKQSIHQYCLRPPMVDLPNDVWHCKGCEPMEVLAERGARGGGRKCYNENALSKAAEASSSEEDADTDHEENCHVCETSSGELILCDTCTLSFHLE